MGFFQSQNFIQGYNACSGIVVTMEPIGTVSEGRSKFLNTLDTWTHFDNNGPRTTNVAEGWHSGLNSRFGVPHPSLRLFLDWLQKCQFAV